MNERDLQLTGLVLVRELLRRRGTDISELELEIDRLTQPEVAAPCSGRTLTVRRRAAPSIAGRLST